MLETGKHDIDELDIFIFTFSSNKLIVKSLLEIFFYNFRWKHDFDNFEMLSTENHDFNDFGMFLTEQHDFDDYCLFFLFF